MKRRDHLEDHMTTDELKAAAERFTNPKPTEAYPWPCDMHEQPAQRSKDAGLLAQAYLAEVPLLLERVAELEAALRPFAGMVAYCREELHGDLTLTVNHHDYRSPTFAACRAAEQLLKGEGST